MAVALQVLADKIRAAHRATLSPAFPRRTGEGAGCSRYGKAWEEIAAGGVFTVIKTY